MEDGLKEKRWMKADKVMELLDCSRSLLCTPEMRQTLGEKRIGKRGVRYTRSCVEAYLAQQTTISKIDQKKQIVQRASKKFESKLGLWR